MSGPELVRLPPDYLERLAAHRDAPEGARFVPVTYFDRRAAVRNLYWHKLRACLDAASNHRDASVADVGCGTGVLLPSLARFYRTVVGVDLFLAEARELVDELELANTRLVKGSVLALPFADASLDQVSLVSVLEHMPELAPAVREVRRVLRPGGRAVVSVPTENLLYQAGRLVTGYTKPDDHYQDVWGVRAALGEALVERTARYTPLNLGPRLSVFYVGAWERPS